MENTTQDHTTRHPITTPQAIQEYLLGLAPNTEVTLRISLRPGYTAKVVGGLQCWKDSTKIYILSLDDYKRGKLATIEFSDISEVTFNYTNEIQLWMK